MATRIIRFASPIEPSGASWLLNCFLELGIRIAHKPVVDEVWRGSRVPPGFMWQDSADGSTLKPKAEVLTKWLPALSRQERFNFRTDVEIEYVQDLATASDDGLEAIFFVRDPRDALYSMFRRVQPELSFEEYLEIPNPQSLLDRVSHWAAQIRSWQLVDGVRFFRFEDYKSDAGSVLAQVLAALDLAYGAEAIERAVAASTSERARAAEDEYRTRYPQDREVANRAGRVGDWRQHAEAASGVARIERATGALMRELGYSFDGGRETPAVAPLQFELLTFLRTVKRPGARAPGARDATTTSSDPPPTCPADLLAFAERVDSTLLRRSRLSPDDVRTLLDSLVEVCVRCAPQTNERLRALRGEFEDGSSYHFERLRALLAERRRSQ